MTLQPSGENHWEPPVQPLYSMKHAFQTRTGLAYTYDSILVGPTKAAADLWTKERMAILAPSLEVERSFAIPLSDKVAKSPVAYCTQYLAKYFLLQKEFGSATKADVWCSKANTNVLQLFQWGTPEVPVITQEETGQIFSKEMVAWIQQDGATDLMRAEEVEALREALGGRCGKWMPEPEEVGDKRRLVIVCDDKYMTEDVIEELEEEIDNLGFTTKVVWAGRTGLEAFVGALRGAWGFVVAAKDEAEWTWVLPRGATVWQVQSEMEPSATALHMAAAGGVEHRLTIVSKGAMTPADKKGLVQKLAQSILDELEKRVDTGAAAGAEGSKTLITVPNLYMPTGHTHWRFAHAGDSFREMARLWAAKGYVNLIEEPGATQIWLGEIGQTLLYDRPTTDWLAAAPVKEQIWSKVALFGNPAPPADARRPILPLFFWPRRPALVEELVGQELHRTAWQDRPQSIVFYGRSENAVQREHRTTADWSAACSEFVHVDGEKPYPFTQEEYLRRLAQARFGLCLAGYGRKCHREIECMAMGCVPIVAPEVDMTNYAMPPREGVHFFRAANPEEAKRLAETTTEDRWMKMSSAAHYWWEQNASVDGSWALTQKLVALSEV